ncbi:MAG: hypothetical protein QGI45_13240, partial [Myxococcota bacterium]|nr:hypothetical protein [Myxococcota bacterium]
MSKVFGHLSALKCVSFIFCLSLVLNVSGCSKGEVLRLRPAFFSASTDVVEFGERIVGQETQQTVYLINSGDMPLDLELPQGDALGGVFAVILDTQTINANKDAVVRVHFSPLEERSYETQISIKNNSDNEADFIMTLKGSGIQPGPCDFVTCQTPPSSICLSEDRSRTYNPAGVCTAGNCEYESFESECENGCNPESGLCVGDPCLGVVCQTPPNACYLAQGTCQDGGCAYPLQNDVACDDGNACTVDESCSEGQCLGTAIVCDNPPSPICVDGEHRKVWQPQGTCQSDTGACAYVSNEQFCPFGCDNGSCAVDPCVDMSCDAPPSAQCYEASGICSDGICSYDFVDGECDDSDACTLSDTCENGACSGLPMVCDSAPSSMCASEETLIVYDQNGSCAEGQCEYNTNALSCDDNNSCTTNDYCADGVCHHEDPLACEDDGNSCTREYCDPETGCERELLSDVDCVTTSSDCPYGTCVEGTCLPQEDVSC